jgi:putative transposase
MTGARSDSYDSSWERLAGSRFAQTATSHQQAILTKYPQKEPIGRSCVSLVTIMKDTPEKSPLGESDFEDCTSVDLDITSYIHTCENLSVDVV